jgi:caffeoyl-CoA O-methyltransferase
MTVYNDALAQYVTETFARPDRVLEQVRAQIPIRGLPEIAVRPEEGCFLQFLVRAIGARRAIEIGTLVLFHRNETHG